MSVEKGNIDFSLLMTSQGLAENARSQISFLNEMQPGQVTYQEIARLYNSENMFANADFLDRANFLLKDDRDFTEKKQSLRQFSETLLHKKTGYLSYGINAICYLNALNLYKSLEINTTHDSLLVGALTSSTVSEFTAVTRHVFPQSNLCVLDKEGVQTPEACAANNVQFQKGDCLNMPFSKHAFDSIQADHLLDQIRTNEKQSLNKKLEIFFSEAHTILKPNGMLILAEPILPRFFPLDDVFTSDGYLDITKVQEEHEQYYTWVSALLKKTGFATVATNDTPSFISRRELDRYIMLGNIWDIPKDVLINNGTTSITAMK